MTARLHVIVADARRLLAGGAGSRSGRRRVPEVPHNRIHGLLAIGFALPRRIRPEAERGCAVATRPAGSNRLESDPTSPWTR